MGLSRWISELKLITLCMMTCVLGLSCSSQKPWNENSTAHETMRTDGSIIHWTLTSAVTRPAQGVLLIAQGSGCSPALSSPNVQLLIEKVPNLHVLTIEKYGVRPNDPANRSRDKCPDAYSRNHTISQRVDDAMIVLKKLRSEGGLTDKLGLFGGSEGGAVVSILSRKIPEADAVVVFSTGTGIPLSKMILPPEYAEFKDEFEKEFSLIRANPNSHKIWSGNSYKWWADVMDRKLSDDLLASKAPILIVRGILDKTTPISADHATKAAFDAANDTRLTYWELEDRGHHMKDSEGVSHMSDVLEDVSDWISEQIE